MIICFGNNFVFISRQGIGFIDFKKQEDAKAALETLKQQGKNVSNLFVSTHKLSCNYQ